jgi:hypothetical protein
LPFFLKNASSHIVLLLLGIFSVTFIPFNVLHHHAEDEHAVAILLHNAHEHHCELDEQFCQPAVNTDCGHDTHLAKPISKCFSCAFHFIKHFESKAFEISNIIVSQQYLFAQFVPSNLRNVWICLSNKGPPFLSC